MKIIEQLFEFGLWKSRLIVMVAVIASVLLSLSILYITTVDVIYMLDQLGQYASPALDQEGRSELRTDIIGQVIGVVDGYLIAAIMIIFGFGIYELFINKIDAIDGSEMARRLLLIKSADDLKERLAKVVLLILVVKFAQQAMQLEYQSVTDLLYLSLSILLIGGAVYFSGHKQK
jgi:uncharacterized membrane protein YqhA